MYIGFMSDRIELKHTRNSSINQERIELSVKLIDQKMNPGSKLIQKTYKITKKLKRLIIYTDFALRLTTVGVPSQAIGLAFPPQTPLIMRSIHSNVGFSKKAIIAQVIKEMPAEIDFTEKEIDQLYNLSIECRNNSLSKEQLITKISNLRGGSCI